jgi:DNA-directed RNA polymerase specialized sigma24 family protein
MKSETHPALLGLQCACEKLKKIRRAELVLKLREQDGLTYSQIGKILHRHQGTAMLAYRAALRLRDNHRGLKRYHSMCKQYKTEEA